MLKKKLFALTLASVLALSAFLPACSKKEAEKTDSEAETTTQNEVKSDESTTEPRIMPDLPASDFGGHEFKILVRTLRTDPNWTDWDHRDIVAEAENGDLINDAVYKRNVTIEDRYKIKISQIEKSGASAVVDEARKTVKAGDATYDAVMFHLLEVNTLAQEGNCINLFKMPNMDLKKPWWNQGCIADLSIGGGLYVIQSDITILDNDATSAMIFNKDLIKKHGLEVPYTYVKSGEWTFDKMIDMMKGVSQDLNGDGKMYILDDKFGAITQADSSLAFLYGTGEKIAKKDENDLPIITFNNERVYKAFEKISTIMLDEESAVDLHRFAGKFPVYEEQAKMFSEDRALFSWIRMRVVEKLRSMETDFGIIPLPKLEKEQSQYWTQMNSHTSAGLSILQSNSDLNRTGIILEALAAESKYTLQPAYYDLNLYGKFTRDEESREMLDIIFNTTVYDIGEVYNFGGFSQQIVFFPTNKKTEYASAFEKAETKIQKDIDKLIEKYNNVNANN